MASELQIRTKLIGESRLDKNKSEGLPRIGQWAVERIRQQIIDKKIKASGKTQNSIAYRVNGETELTIYAAAGERAPIQTLQWGRAGGKMPPVINIKKWIKDKGITVKEIAYKRQTTDKWKPKYTPQERGLNSLAWAIATKIKESGTVRHREPQTDVYTPVLNEVVELFTTFIAKKYQGEILKSIMQ